MIGSWWIDTLGQLRSPLALKFIDTVLNLYNFPKAYYTQVAPLKISTLKTKSRITEKIMTQCPCPKCMYMASEEGRPMGEECWLEAEVSWGAGPENLPLLQVGGHTFSIEEYPHDFHFVIIASYFLSAYIHFLNANLYCRGSPWFRILFCSIKIYSPRE